MRIEKPGALLLALPTYGRARLNTNAVLTALTNHAPFSRLVITSDASSLLAFNFNRMWAKALNDRRQGVTHFLMLHDDVCPHEATWVEDLYAIMERVGASVLSAVLPIKNTEGLTSTALERADRWQPRRLALTEIEQRPATFTDPALLINTGMLLVDFRQPWVEKVHFTINDTIRRAENDDYYASAEPEDWYFTRRAREYGASIWATREVRATHLGLAGYDNFGEWGTLNTDNKQPVDLETVMT